MCVYLYRSLCSKKVVKDFQDVHFSCVDVEGRIANSNINGFSSFPGNLFTILVYYFEVGDVGIGMIVGHTVLVNFSGYMTAVFSTTTQEKCTSWKSLTTFLEQRDLSKIATKWETQTALKVTFT